MTERFGQKPKLQEANTVLTKTAFGLALVLATASSALAAAKTHAIVPNQNVYNPAGAYVGADGIPAFVSNCNGTGTARAPTDWTAKA
jgi:hypothetical protein